MCIQLSGASGGSHFSKVYARLRCRYLVRELNSLRSTGAKDVSGRLSTTKHTALTPTAHPACSSNLQPRTDLAKGFKTTGVFLRLRAVIGNL